MDAVSGGGRPTRPWTMKRGWSSPITPLRVRQETDRTQWDRHWASAGPLSRALAAHESQDSQLASVARLCALRRMATHAHDFVSTTQDRERFTPIATILWRRIILITEIHSSKAESSIWAEVNL